MNWNIYFQLNKKQDKKRKETKEEKRISAENLTGYNDIVCEFALCTYLMESWISPGCSYEFNVVYGQREKSQHWLYYNNIWNEHFQEHK